MSMSGHSGGSTMKLYRYDEYNRLVEYHDDGSNAEYTYSVNNLRASKTVNGVKTTYVWNGQNLASETKNNTTTVYAYDPTGVISSKTGNELTRFIKDPHGNVIATSKNNTIFGTYDYTAFGNQIENTDTTTPFRYCGEYYDEESGLTYLRNRYYNSATGRFISEDPVKDGTNWYIYCDNNPVMGMDPKGTYPYFGYFMGSYTEDYNIIKETYGQNTAKKASQIAYNSMQSAETYKKHNGLTSAHNNEVDAYRHFIWNVRLTREIGYDEAKTITNVHEELSMKNSGWIYENESNSKGYANSYIRGRMNQESFMDLWNNQVGRELAHNKDFAHMNESQLYNMAVENGWLIMEANDRGNVFEFLGISSCITNQREYTVDVKWDLTSGNIVVYNQQGNVFNKLKIGV